MSAPEWPYSNGIVWSRPYKLAWGHKHGALRWLPYPIKRFIVHWWNWTACRIFGHDRLTIPAEDGWEAVDSCVSCCKGGGRSERKG